MNLNPMPSGNYTLFKASLMILILMILGMVIIGGVTRLTGSGLSIVEWKPLIGILPPLTTSDWTIEFSKYQLSPEFQKINFGMTLSDFQSIYWLEYIHRLWGRLLGVVLLIPTLLMILKKQHVELWLYLTSLWILGASQGAMGWLMVKSGLILDPHVSAYRLAAHLFLGFAIFGVALWMGFKLYQDKLSLPRKGFSQKAFVSLRTLSLIAFLLILLTALLGALVAGLKAGLLYNTFPLMGERLIPHEFLTLSPWWRDFLENPVSVQFLHRIAATITAFFCIWIWVYQYTLTIPQKLSYSFGVVATFALLQVFLGILTLLHEVPIVLATLHQGMAFLLFGGLLYVLFLIYNRERD